MKILYKTFITLILVTSLFGTAIASDAKLTGHWKGGNIDLKLKSNHSYTYKVKVFNFSGKWSATKNVLTLNYSIAGIKRKKTARYHFKGKDLVLKQEGKGNVVLKKQ